MAGKEYNIHKEFQTALSSIPEGARLLLIQPLS
jgi:hypothetical protein